MENINQTVNFLILTVGIHSWNYAYVQQRGNRNIDDDVIYIVLFLCSYTPLHHAAQQGHINLVNILLEHKADPDAKTTVCLFFS